MKKYIGFADREDVAREFEVGTGNRWEREVPYGIPEGFPTDEEFVVACYHQEDYEGDAYALFLRDGKLFEVKGGHCSCYGLEGQWEPEETTVAALRLRLDNANYGAMNTAEVKTLIREFLQRYEVLGAAA